MFFTFSFTTVIEIALCLDLGMTLSKPFANPQKRVYLSIMTAFIVALISGVSVITTGDVSAPINQIIFYGLKAVFFVTMFYSLGTTFYSFKTRGLSKQFRGLLFKRQISFCILTIFCQLTSLLEWIEFVNGVEFPDWIQAIECYYFVAVAFILALLRLNEPIVLNTFKKDIMFCSVTRANADVSNYSGSVHSNDSSPFSDPDMRKGSYDNEFLTDSLNAFLTSSLNVELVYTILKGIRRIVKTPDLETWKNGQMPESEANDFSMKLQLDNIKIRNFKIWEEAH